MGVHAVGFSGGLVVKNLPANSGDAGLNLGWGKSPGEGNGQPTLVFFPGKSHGQKSLVGYSPWGRKDITAENFTGTVGIPGETWAP